VDGYRLSLLIGTGLAVLAAIIVALQLSSKSHRVEPRHQQAGPGGPTPAPPAPALLGNADGSPVRSSVSVDIRFENVTST
jgi:hypothetical protein